MQRYLQDERALGRMQNHGSPSDSKTPSCLFMWTNCPGVWSPELNGVQASLQQRLIERKLTDAEIDQLSVMSMSGVAAEAQTYEEVSAARL